MLQTSPLSIAEAEPLDLPNMVIPLVLELISLHFHSDYRAIDSYS